ncbi:MAG: hypothetical protein WBL61_23535, partial [Bryobacteraceae bacterium]
MKTTETFRRFVRLLITAILIPAAALATDCRFTLVDQSNWYANTGFYMDLENSPAGSSTYCQLANMTIAVGVADGAQWRFIVQRPSWKTNHTYTAEAVITPTYFELYLDGQFLWQVFGGFSSLPNQDLLVNAVPSWADGPGDYIPSQSSIDAESSGGVTASGSFAADARLVPLMLLAPGSNSLNLPFQYNAGDSLTVTAVFSLTSVSNMQSYAPYVDTYGQSVYSNFAGKIQTDTDLQTAAAEEQTALAAWGTPTGYDAWGGVLKAGWQDEATGYFHVVQHNGVWWLISPVGNPCFYIGLDTGPLITGNNTPTTNREWEFAALPPKTGPYNAAWSSGDWGNTGIASFSFDTWNMIRKYGGDWQNIATNLTVQRMNAWGFSGFGKWASEAGNLPILPVLEPYNVPIIAVHPDIFDPAVQGDLQSTLRQQIAASVNDSRILGWSFGNEYDDLITPAEVQTILDLGSTVPAKRALMNQALSAIYGNNVANMAAAWGVKATTIAGLYSSSPTPPAADIETLREYYEDQYFGFVYQAIKGIDPNHLYFGIWIVPGWWVNATDWQLNAAHVDVIGYDNYSPVFENSLLEGLLESTAKPAFLGEYSFPPSYNLLRGYELYAAANATDDANAGAQYQSNLQSAARNPWCIGVAWFEYRDEPVSGRGFLGETDLDLVEGEDYAFGMVDVADRPKYDLVNLVRTTNLAMAQRRLAFGPPSLSAGGVIDNASFAIDTPVAPGSLVSIFGADLAGDAALAAGPSLPLVLGTTALTFGGFPVPLIHAFPGQVDAQVPWELAGQTAAPLTIVTDDLSGNTISVPLAEFSPGLYTATGTGSGQGSILINGTATLAAPASGPFAGQPAHRGTDYIDIFSTGLGPVTNQPASGAPAPASPNPL